MFAALVIAAALARAGAGTATQEPGAPGASASIPDAGVPTPPPEPAGGVVLLAPGATWQVATADAPSVPAQLAAVSLGGLDVAAGRRAAGVSVFGDAAAGAPPPAWPLADRDDATARTAPLGFDAPAGQRVAIAWATARFTIAPDAGDLRVVDVEARYHDGIAIWINGVEVARRRIDAREHPLALAAIPRGGDWETFHVPVVPGLLRAGDNVVAVEVRPSGRYPVPGLDLAIVARVAAAPVRGPVLAAVTHDAATVLVDTDLDSDAAVEWGPSDALGTRVASTAGRARRHAIALTDLPATVYYRVLVDGAATPIRTFRTLPGPGEVVRIAVYGDVRSGHDVHAAIVARIRAEDPDLVLATGDLVVRGSDEGEWQRFFAIAGELVATVPYWSAPGNHDTGQSGDARRRFGDLLAVPNTPAPRPAWASWYSIDAGDVHVAFLDSNAYDQPAQLAWLDGDLAAAAARGARVVFAVTHDGPYSRGDHGGNAVAAATYVPVLVRHGVTLLFAGHDHLYQRGRQGGLDYIVSGGGGAELYPLSCGVPGKKPCKVDDGMVFGASEHHYVMVTTYPTFVEACARHADGTAVEPCVRYAIRKPD